MYNVDEATLLLVVLFAASMGLVVVHRIAVCFLIKMANNNCTHKKNKCIAVNVMSNFLLFRHG